MRQACHDPTYARIYLTLMILHVATGRLVHQSCIDSGDVHMFMLLALQHPRLATGRMHEKETKDDVRKDCQSMSLTCTLENF